MKNFFRILVILLLLTAYTTKAENFDETRFGLGAGASVGINESKDRPFNLSFGALFRQPFNEMFAGEFSIGYVPLSGETYVTSGQGKYETNLIPIDLKLLFSPIRAKSWYPYLLGGFGVFNYDAKTPSPVADAQAKDKGWAPYFCLGAGIEAALSSNFSLDFHASGNRSFTDDINGEYDNPSIYDGYWNLTLSIIYTPWGVDGDSDGDGLLDSFEDQIGTNPDNPDTDGDGLKDGAEYNKYKTNPMVPDTDGDGLKDGAEVDDYNTDPLKADTDGDGLKDGEEVMTYKTDPNKADTDGDGLKDGEEVLTYKTDPLKADTDGDGLNDGDEVLKHRTDPLKMDTDGDDLNDGAEVTRHKTDPTKIDTDGDGLKDGEEVTKYKTNPTMKDTDKGGVDDGTEVAKKQNPLDGTDDYGKKTLGPQEIGAKIVLEGVLFETGKSKITPASDSILIQAYETLVAYPNMEVLITGHTDNVGKRDKNIKLSQDRADAVKTWLVNRGIASSRMTTKGYGPDKPITLNDTPENKQKNRRIEFERTK